MKHIKKFNEQSGDEPVNRDMFSSTLTDNKGEETKQRLYTEDEMKQFIEYVAGIYKPISQSGVIIYWTDSYNNKNAPKLSTNDLLTKFINQLNK